MSISWELGTLRKSKCLPSCARNLFHGCLTINNVKVPDHNFGSMVRCEVRGLLAIPVIDYPCEPKRNAASFPIPFAAPVMSTTLSLTRLAWLNSLSSGIAVMLKEMERWGRAGITKTTFCVFFMGQAENSCRKLHVIFYL